MKSQRVLLLVGPRQSGKTTDALELVRQLKATGYEAGYLRDIERSNLNQLPLQGIELPNAGYGM